MEEKKLYPLSFCTLADEYAWGTDEFLLADLGYRDSIIREGWLAGNTVGEVMDTYMDRVTGENVFTFWGRQFPVQVKHIRVKGLMPLRVHPDAETAVRRYDFLGREKLWYVLRAGEGSRLLVGWNSDTDASEVYPACSEGTATSLLRSFTPEAGQFIHIPPGTPHAAKGNVEILEISESSPLDFCLCSFGQPVSPEEFDETLDLTAALDFVDYKAFAGDLQSAPKGVEETLLNLTEFTVKRLDLSSPIRVGEADSFVLYTCVKGAASVQMEVLGQTALFPVGAGKTLLVPAECPGYALVPEEQDTVILEVTVAPRKEKDSYLG